MRERYEIMKAMHTLIRAMNDEGAYCSWIRDAYEALGLGSEINRVLMRALVRAKYREEYGDR